MTYRNNNILELCFIIDPTWLHRELYLEFKNRIQKLDYLSKDEIKPFLEAKTFRDVLVTGKSIKKMSSCMLIAHLINGCYTLHQGMHKNNLVKLQIKIEFCREVSTNAIQYKSCTCVEKVINRMEYLLSNEIGNINNKYDK